MKLELPEDHPIAQAIREATGPGWQNTNRLLLSLDALQRDGSVARIFTLEIDSWSKTRETKEYFECALTDPEERAMHIRALSSWPVIDQ